MTETLEAPAPATFAAPPGCAVHSLDESQIDEIAAVFQAALQAWESSPRSFDSAHRVIEDSPPQYVIDAANVMLAEFDTLGEVPVSRMPFLCLIALFRGSLETWLTSSPQHRSPSARNVWSMFADAQLVRVGGAGRKPLGTPLELFQELTGRDFVDNPHRPPPTDVLREIARQHRRRDERGNWDFAWAASELREPKWSQADWIDTKAAKHVAEAREAYSRVQLAIAERAGRPLPRNAGSFASAEPATARPATFIKS